MLRYALTRWLKRLGLGLAAVLITTWAWLLMSHDPLPGIRFAGESLGDGNTQRLVRERHDAWKNAKVVVHTGPYVTRITREELGITRDPDRGLNALLAVGRQGNPLVDLSMLFRALRGSVDVAWPIQVDQHRLGDFVRKLRHRMERPPIAGTTTRDGRAIEGIPGLTINAMTAVSLLKDALLRNETEVHLSTRQIPPPIPVTFEALNASAQFGTLLSTYQTQYARGGRSAGRANNVELAGMKLDGVVIAPGDTLSFNALVGERSLARGFQVAPELANQMVVEGVGGGVCQTAATLHAAAFLGAFEIVEYRPHSRPTRYVPTGLDTMVSWPDKDLKLRNPYPFPIRIAVNLATSGAVTVSLFGAGQAHPVDWNAEVLETTPAGEKRIEDSAVRLGEEELRQTPIDGVVIRRTRTVYLPSGPRSEEQTLRYPPTPKIVAIPGF